MEINHVQRTGKLISERIWHGICFIGDLVYVVGGLNHDPLKFTEMISIKAWESSHLSELVPLSAQFFDAQAISMRSKIFISSY
jgi:hypothetical protein